MKTREEIEAELAATKIRLDKILPGCKCGCQNETIHFYQDKIQILEWVLNIKNHKETIKDEETIPF